MTRTAVTKSSGNVFRDLGFSEEKSAELILKSSLLQALQETIKGRGWKQVEAAVQLGIDQAKVSKLLAGQMAGFSIERLVHFLASVGQDVEVTVRSAPRGQKRGTVNKYLRQSVQAMADSFSVKSGAKAGMRGRDAETGAFVPTSSARGSSKTSVVERVPKPGYGKPRPK